MSWGRFHQSPYSMGIPAMGRCSRSNPAPRNVVVIDGDEDEDGSPDPEVLIIGDSAGKARAASACKTKKGNSSGGNVINIDDDDDEGGGSGSGGRGGGDRAGPSTAGGVGSPVMATPRRGSSGKNRYGLDYISDSDYSDLSEGASSDVDGSSDCEILDDASGTARTQWEKAASRKTMPQHPRERKNGRATTSASSAESSTQPDGNLENLFGAECHINEGIWEYFSDAWREVVPNSTGGTKYDAGPSSVPCAPRCSEDNASNAKEAEGCNATSRLDPDTACDDENAHSRRSFVPEEVLERNQSPHLDETCEPEGHTSCSFVSANRDPTSSSTDWKFGTPYIFVPTPGNMNEKIPDGRFSQKEQAPPSAHNEFTKQNKEMCSEPDNGSVTDQLTEDPPFSSRCGCLMKDSDNSAREEADCCACAAAANKNPSVNVTSGDCTLPLKDLVDDPEKIGESAMVQDAADFHGGLISEREKHKESDEYKRAIEEEWASRHRQLQIQAEEAKEEKRLRKRKKAEAMRLLDMEKRQKQRLEEVRESQRKNEEEIRLKEEYRGAVRQELENMERSYFDMASILRVLGIPVEGVEVKAAYKQALLKFHPDRVSRSDIYQQVKAEETFKFISRLKDKLFRVF